MFVAEQSREQSLKQRRTEILACSLFFPNLKYCFGEFHSGVSKKNHTLAHTFFYFFVALRLIKKVFLKEVGR